jgi:diguanylate cyclase (GGDEF)-like protein
LASEVIDREVAGTVDEALRQAERLRQAIGEQPVVTGAGNIGVTGSLGVAPLDLRENLWDALKRADIQLYAAKRSGRNKVMAAATANASFSVS